MLYSASGRVFCDTDQDPTGWSRGLLGERSIKEKGEGEVEVGMESLQNRHWSDTFKGKEDEPQTAAQLMESLPGQWGVSSKAFPLRMSHVGSKNPDSNPLVMLCTVWEQLWQSMGSAQMGL